MRNKGPPQNQQDWPEEKARKVAAQYAPFAHKAANQLWVEMHWHEFANAKTRRELGVPDGSD